LESQTLRQGLQHTVFISHAGSDTQIAREVAEVLAESSLRAIVDRDEIRTGDSFLSFMERSLQESDYCLLLWSEAASKSPWVRVEWEAAFWRTIQQSRRFLIVGRLQDFDSPMLLTPRLRVDLYPRLRPGIDEFVHMVRDDSDAEESSRRPIGQPTAPVPDDKNGELIYLTSELFGLTMPLQLDFQIPIGIHLDRVRTELGLPDQQTVRERIGVRYEYHLLHNDQRLSRSSSLAQQGIAPKNVLWLQVEMQPFAATTPAAGSLEPVSFRGHKTTLPSSPPVAEPLDSFSEREARKKLLAAIAASGLVLG